MSLAALRSVAYAVYRATGFRRRISFPSDFRPDHIEIINRVRPHTMTSAERLYGLIESIRYVSRSGIPGAVVECGVWKGGSMMAAALALLAEDDIRDLYLYDTFDGMPEPTDRDVDYRGRNAKTKFAEQVRRGKRWAYASLDEVRDVMVSTGYPADRIHYVRGLVEHTIPALAPETIALLRLDTDWYNSTAHELQHLYPRVSPGGVLIVDDYGHYRGSRDATDEYIEAAGLPLLLTRMDYTGRLAVKPGARLQ